MSPERLEGWLGSTPLVRNLINLFCKLGLGTVLVIAGAWWFGTSGLPMYLTAQREQQETFLRALERIEDRHREAEAQASAAVRELTTEIRWLGPQIRRTP